MLDDEKKAEKSIIEGFDHFHREGFHQINDSYFPSEAYAVGGMYRFGKSKLDQPLVGLVMNHFRPLGIRLSNGAVMKLIEKFSLYNIYKTVFEAKEKNFIAYIIFSNTSMENTEFSEFSYTKLYKIIRSCSFISIISQLIFEAYSKRPCWL